MCYGWYEEALIAERLRLARQKAEDEKQSTAPRTPAKEADKTQKPERKPETQPDAVPA